MTDSGYIKSRFLDDKLSVAILLELAARVASGEIKPSRRVWEHITVFEEVGHGGSASVPEGVTEAIQTMSPGWMPSFSTSSRLETSSSMTTSMDLYSRLAEW